jgi:hypothetical protein
VLVEGCAVFFGQGVELACQLVPDGVDVALLAAGFLGRVGRGICLGGFEGSFGLECFEDLVEGWFRFRCHELDKVLPGMRTNMTVGGKWLVGIVSY